MNKKIKVLHTITLSEWGGAQRVCYDIVTHLDQEKFLVEVACKPGGILVDKLEEKGIKVYKIPSFRREISPINDFKTLISLYKLIKKGKYHIVHCHSTKAGFLGRIAAKLARVPKIYFTVHGWGFYNQEYGRFQKLLIFLEKIAARCSTRIICVSENDKKEGAKEKIAPENKFLIIKNGIEWETKEDQEKVRQNLGINENEVVFSMVGRLAYPKNPSMFLRTAKEVSQKYFQAKFALIGGGPLFQECQNFIKENKLENKIFLLGEKNPEETREILTGFDVFVLTSRFEGLPITIIEAMFAGLPIIATNVGGVKELVREGENGFLVDSDSDNDLVKKMGYLIDNPLKRKEMGKESLKIAQENFTLEKMIRNYEKLYKEKRFTLV